MKFDTRIAVFIVAILIVALTSDSSAKPAEEKEEYELQRQLLPTPLSTVLAGLAGLFAGLALGGALGGISRGNRRWGRRGRCGRRDLDGEDDPLDKIEEDLMSEMMDVMIQTEVEECYERMICDIASRNQGFSEFTDLLNFFSDDEDLFVAEQYKGYHAKMKAARMVGDDAEGDFMVCEETYGCPLTGEEMATQIKEQFSEDMED